MFRTESEVIGLIPAAALAGEGPERILWNGYKDTQIIEYWLDNDGHYLRRQSSHAWMR